MEVRGNNRSVMPLDALGRTRATLTSSSSLQPGPEGLGNLFKSRRAGDRLLQFLILNEEFLVNARHQRALITVPALCTHRPSLLPIEPLNELCGLVHCVGLSFTEHREADQIC